MENSLSKEKATEVAGNLKDKIVNGAQQGFEKLTQNMKLVSGGRAGIFILLVIALILFVYSLSYSYRVSKVVENMGEVYDNLMLIKRSISEYDLELTSNIFNHKTVITMLSNIDEYCTDTNANKNQFIQFINLNHLNTSLIITILSLINQEKNIFPVHFRCTKF